MKCLRVLLLGCLVAFLSVPLYSFSLDEQTFKDLKTLQLAYQKNTEKLNNLSIASELDLMELQEQLPQLLQQVTELQSIVQTLISESQQLELDSKQLTQQLNDLNKDIKVLSSSLEQIETSISTLEKSLKEYQNKSTISLIIGSSAVLGIIFLCIKIFL